MGTNCNSFVVDMLFFFDLFFSNFYLKFDDTDMYFFDAYAKLGKKCFTFFATKVLALSQSSFKTALKLF